MATRGEAGPAMNPMPSNVVPVVAESPQFHIISLPLFYLPFKGMPGKDRQFFFVFAFGTGD